MPRAAQLTGKHSWHKGSKHEEQHGEEEATRVVEDLAGIIANVQVEETNEHTNHHMGHEPQVGQDLCDKVIMRRRYRSQARDEHPHWSRNVELPSQAHRPIDALWGQGKLLGSYSPKG